MIFNHPQEVSRDNSLRLPKSSISSIPGRCYIGATFFGLNELSEVCQHHLQKIIEVNGQHAILKNNYKSQYELIISHDCIDIYESLLKKELEYFGLDIVSGLSSFNQLNIINKYLIVAHEIIQRNTVYNMDGRPIDPWPNLPANVTCLNGSYLKSRGGDPAEFMHYVLGMDYNRIVFNNDRLEGLQGSKKDSCAENERMLDYKNKISALNKIISNSDMSCVVVLSTNCVTSDDHNLVSNHAYTLRYLEDKDSVALIDPRNSDRLLKIDLLSVAKEIDNIVIGYLKAT
jgi:hypothetical protein